MDPEEPVSHVVTLSLELDLLIEISKDLGLPLDRSDSSLQLISRDSCSSWFSGFFGESFESCGLLQQHGAFVAMSYKRRDSMNYFILI